ncbi:MAG: small basic protein [Candidatus Omnitrophota bacterium]
MPIHPSLNIPEKEKKQRSVLKRIERLKSMQIKEQWKPGDSVFGLPKIKSIKIKIKKEKVDKAAETAGTEAQAGTTAQAAGSKDQTQAKSSASKAQDKK